MIDPSLLITAFALFAGALGWAEKRYRDMRGTLVELRVNQQWIINRAGEIDNDPGEGLVGDGGDRRAEAVKQAINQEWPPDE